MLTLDEMGFNSLFDPHARNPNERLRPVRILLASREVSDEIMKASHLLRRAIPLYTPSIRSDEERLTSVQLGDRFSIPKSSVRPVANALKLGAAPKMPEPPRVLTHTAANFHRGMKTTADSVGILLVDGFHYLALFAIGATTVWSAFAAFFSMLGKGRAELADILLLFIYLEIGAMVGIYFKTTKLPVRYLIYIAMTALGRVLIEIGGAEHKTGKDLLIVAGAILVLSLAVLMLRFASHKDDPSDKPSL
jgi:protein PsiE